MFICFWCYSHITLLLVFSVLCVSPYLLEYDVINFLLPLECVVHFLSCGHFVFMLFLASVRAVINNLVITNNPITATYSREKFRVGLY
jgi:hypothetical protein